MWLDTARLRPSIGHTPESKLWEVSKLLASIWVYTVPVLGPLPQRCIACPGEARCFACCAGRSARMLAHMGSVGAQSIRRFCLRRFARRSQRRGWRSAGVAERSMPRLRVRAIGANYNFRLMRSSLSETSRPIYRTQFGSFGAVNIAGERAGAKCRRRLSCCGIRFLWVACVRLRGNCSIPHCVQAPSTKDRNIMLCASAPCCM